MTEPDPAFRANENVTRSSRYRAVERLRAIPWDAFGRVRVPTARISQAAGSTTRLTRKGLGSLRARGSGVEHRIRRRRMHGTRATVDRRPDGTPVSPSVELVPSSPPAGRTGVVAQVSAPLLSLRDSLRDHWNDSVREAKLAAREKETEMRAEYERRVAHDPHLHAEQHNRGHEGDRH